MLHTRQFALGTLAATSQDELTPLFHDMKRRAYLEKCMAQYRQGAMGPTEAAILKLRLTEMQCATADVCLQLFGGYGYTREYPISRFYLDARVQTIYAGTSEIMKEVIARSLLGKA